MNGKTHSQLDVVQRGVEETVSNKCMFKKLIQCTEFREAIVPRLRDPTVGASAHNLGLTLSWSSEVQKLLEIMPSIKFTCFKAIYVTFGPPNVLSIAVLFSRAPGFIFYINQACRVIFIAVCERKDARFPRSSLRRGPAHSLA